MTDYNKFVRCSELKKWGLHVHIVSSNETHTRANSNELITEAWIENKIPAATNKNNNSIMDFGKTN